MTITADIRQQVRQRAGCACEFCGVTEESAASELTIDRLRLNRPPLVNNRRQRAERAKELMLLQRANEMVLLRLLLRQR